MNINYFTTKKLFKHKENKDRFMSLYSIDYQLTKRNGRDSQDFLDQPSESYNQKLKKLIQENDRESWLKSNLIERTEPMVRLFNGFDAIVNTDQNHRNFRTIDEKAYKVLDAPGYSKDNYSHSIDANNDGLLAALIDNQVFLNSTVTGKTQKLVSNLTSINSLKYMNRNEILVIGTSLGHLALYDLNKETSIIIRDQHKGAVTSIDFTTADNIISVGKDCKARVFDIRTNKQGKIYDHYTDPIYTVKTNPNNPFIFSTGESNGMLSIVDTRFDDPLFYRKEHNSGIRALTWNLHKRDVLYSAGLATSELRAINSINFEPLYTHQLATGACDLLFSKISDELLVAQNNGSNTIEVRNAKSLSKLAELKGHSKPIIDLCHLRETDIISGSLDQSLRFWNLCTVQPNLCKQINTTDSNKKRKARTSSLMLR